MAPTRPQDRRIPVGTPRGIVGPCGPAPAQPLSTTIRAEYSRHGCTVYGWPSSGSVIARSNCDIVELKYLSWDPLHAPESRIKDQEQEDAFCAKLRMIGGKWLSSRRRFLDVTEEQWYAEDVTDDESRQVWIGWPEGGGVLVLDGFKEEMHWHIGILRLATTMEERCQLMRDRLDAEYYEDPTVYLSLADLDLDKIKG